MLILWHKKNANGDVDNPMIYDLTFAADKYLLEKKYADFIFPSLPTLQVDYLLGVPNGKDYQNDYNTDVIIANDSTKYVFHYYQCSAMEEGSIYNEEYSRARYSGNIQELASLIQRAIQESRPKANMDAVYIFSGIVTVDGELKELKVIEGTLSPLSDTIIDVLQNDKHTWIPQA